MIKGKTALTVFTEFVDKFGREPGKEEFMKLGYCERTFRRARKDFRKEKEQECEINE